MVAVCGRFTLTEDGKILMEQFKLDALPDDYVPRYNVAPGQPILSIGEKDRIRRATMLRWGLVPSWAKDPRIGYKMINARSETVAVKPSFRQPFQRRRCLVPADGFYEWRQEGSRKVPFRFRLQSRELFAFAGLWDAWRSPDSPDADPLFTCTILTTEPNEVVAPVHNRMPVMLKGEDVWSLWLDPAAEGEELQELLRPFPAEQMERYEVSPLVNSARNEEPECIEPV